MLRKIVKVNAINALSQVFPINSVSTSIFQSIHLLLICFHVENISQVLGLSYSAGYFFRLNRNY